MSVKPSTTPPLALTDPLLHPHSALYRVDISSQDSALRQASNFPQMDSCSPHSRYQTTCIPSLMPPGVDPTSVDFRTFFPYIPNEVKHRKRTSRSQLKVLEDVFRKDTKPNAALRKQLATQLDMLPRAVQVWFQNRRAKDKQQRKRAVHQAVDQTKSSLSHSPQLSCPKATPPDESPDSSVATERPSDPAEDDGEAASDPLPTETSPGLKISSPRPCPPNPPVSLTGWQSSPGTPVDGMPSHHTSSHDFKSQDPDLYSLRRGSLPTVMPSLPTSGPDSFHPPSYPVDRRKSLDMNCYRLMQHPFAHIAKEKNEAIMAKSPLSPPGSTQAVTRSPPGLTGTMGTFRPAPHSMYSYPYTHPRPSLAHRASEPHVFTPLRTPFPPIPEGCSSLPSASHPISRRAYDNRLFALTSRPFAQTHPGPLPTPDFQFGNPSSTSSPPHTSSGSVEMDTPLASSSNTAGTTPSPDLSGHHRLALPRGSLTSTSGPREIDGEVEDNSTIASSFSAVSRFGSVASVAGSESSAVYSDISSCPPMDPLGFDPSVRRGSCPAGHYLEGRMSALTVNGQVNDLNNASAQAGYAPVSIMADDNSQMSEVSTNSASSVHGDAIYDFGVVPQRAVEIAAARRPSLPSSIAVSSPLPTPDQNSRPNGMYMNGLSPTSTSIHAEVKYPGQQWGSNPAGYVTSLSQQFSPHDTDPSFVADASGAANDGSRTYSPLPHTHHQHPQHLQHPSHSHLHAQPHTHSTSEMAYSQEGNAYPVSNAMSVLQDAMRIHAMTGGFDVSGPAHSNPVHVDEYGGGEDGGNGMFVSTPTHGHDPWGFK